MEVLGWLWWALVVGFGFLWSLLWFLISGWVSAIAQIAILIAAVYFLKYGWQRAPAELWRRTSSFGRFFWTWLRARDPQAVGAAEVREVIRVVRTKEFGDVNISTLLSLLMLLGLVLVTRL